MAGCSSSSSSNSHPLSGGRTKHQRVNTMLPVAFCRRVVSRVTRCEAKLALTRSLQMRRLAPLQMAAALVTDTYTAQLKECHANGWLRYLRPAGGAAW